jgi:hypothetical protein
MQPVLDDYDRQIEDIRRNGAEGQLARMQAQDDPLGIAAGNAMGAVMPRSGSGGLIPLAGPPGGYGDDPNPRPAPMDLGGAYQVSPDMPSPTLEDGARSAPFNLSNKNLTDIWNKKEKESYTQSGIKALVGAIAGAVLPEEKIPEYARYVLPRAIDFLNGNFDLLDRVGERAAYERALMNHLNSMEVQRATGSSVPPAARGFMQR